MSLSKDKTIKGLVDQGVCEEKAIRRVIWCDSAAKLVLECVDDDSARRAMREKAQATLGVLATLEGKPLEQVTIDFVEPGGALPSESEPTSSGIPGVRHLIAVGAGKGGVGKSTIAVNLAVALARTGSAVGLLDGDIYGPSVPTLLGLDGHEAMMHEKMLQPFYVHGVKTMTIGKLVDPEKPLIWRGPMAHGAFKQLVEQTQWGELDYMVIDLPPGTGDVPLTMAQMLHLRGAVIVCTPQKVAQDDAVRAARMFQQLNIDVLGVIENMSYFVGDDGKEYDLFGRGGAEAMAQRLGLPFLGAVPITISLRENSDAGDPTRNFDGEGNEVLREALEGIAVRVEDEVARKVLGSGGPVLRVS